VGVVRGDADVSVCAATTLVKGMNEADGGAPPPGVIAEMARQPGLSAEIQRIEFKGNETSAYFVVKISSQSDGYNSYLVRRRYQQFDDLQKALKAKFSGIPEMPGKTLSVFGNSKDAAQQLAESRKQPLTQFLRVVLADPVISKSDEVANFLELSSALELFAKLHKKDIMSQALIATKDEEIENLRTKLAAATTDRSKARAEAASLRESLEEGEAVRRQLREKLQVAEERVAEEESKAEKNAALLADASAKAGSAEREAAATKKALEQARTKAAADAEAASAEHARLLARLEVCEQQTAEARRTLSIREEQLEAAEVQISETRQALSERDADLEAVTKAMADAEALERRLRETEQTLHIERTTWEKQKASIELGRCEAEEKAAQLSDKLAAAEASAAAALQRASAELLSAKTTAAESISALEARAVAGEAQADSLRRTLDRAEATAREAVASLSSGTSLESKYAVAVGELALARSSIGEAQAASAAAQATAEAAQAEASELRAAWQQCRAELDEARAAHVVTDAANAEVLALSRRALQDLEERANRAERLSHAMEASDGDDATLLEKANWALRAALGSAEAKIEELGTALERERAAAAEHAADLAAMKLAAVERQTALGAMGGRSSLGNGTGSSAGSGAGSGGSNRGDGGGGALSRSGSARPSSGLPSPTQVLGSFTVSVASSREGGPENGFKWLYAIAVECGTVSYQVPKRYSDFKALHYKLATLGLRGTPKLPPAYAFSSQDAKFAERRRVELDAYLAALVQQPQLRSSVDLHTFLELSMLLRRSVTIA